MLLTTLYYVLVYVIDVCTTTAPIIRLLFLFLLVHCTKLDCEILSDSKLFCVAMTTKKKHASKDGMRENVLK